MPNNTIIYIFNRIIRLSILFFILYLIFTNFGTFLMIIGIIFVIIGFLVYNFKKKMRTSSYSFKFDSSHFQNGQNFNFNEFRNFNQSDFQGFANAPRFDEVAKAKEFFGFTHSPTKEEIKKRYKELARKYHPDINNGDDVKMKELNHYRDVLMKTVE
jgi:energy-coupling factor transporter transmembrane protein EcfT